MTDALTFAIAVPGRDVISLNDRARWQAAHRQTVALRQRAGWTMRLLGSPKLPAARCEVEVYYPDHRHRDVHNLMGTVKPLIDGMVRAGLLPDDADEYLTGPHLVPGLPAELPRSVIVVPPVLRPFTFAFTFTPRPAGVGQ